MATVNALDSLINDLSSVNKVIIGVCGGISSGKSSLCKALKDKYNYNVINADHIGHSILNDKYVIDKVVEAFGDKVLKDKDDNKTLEIDRKKLGPIVFSDKNKLNQLNDIMWPIIGDKVVGEIKKFKYDKNNKHKYLFVEAAVLIEAKWHQLNEFDEIWITTVSKDIACSRLMKRNNLDQKQAMDRITAVMTNQEKISILDNAKNKNFKNYVVIENEQNGLEAFNKTIDETVKQLNSRYNSNQH